MAERERKREREKERKRERERERREREERGRGFVLGDTNLPKHAACSCSGYDVCLSSRLRAACAAAHSWLRRDPRVGTSPSPSSFR